MNSILHDLGELPLPALVLVGLFSGATALGIKPGAVNLLRAIRGFFVGMLFGGVFTLLTYVVVVWRGYLPEKWSFALVSFFMAYLSHQIRAIVDAIGQNLSKNKAKAAKQIVIYVLEFILSKIKKP